MSGPLGFIPAFQFSANPNENPYVNPTVTMPPNLYQAGVYSEQPAYAAFAQPTLNGVGNFDCLGCQDSGQTPGRGPTQYGRYFPTTQAHRPNGLYYPTTWPENGRSAPSGLGYVMIDEPDGRKIIGPAPSLGFLDISNPFDSFWWVNRKWFLIGGVALAGLTLASLLR